MSKIKEIRGGLAKDQRGQIRFVNDFDMSLVKRFYIIKNSDVELIRGWRAHRIEQRWFYVLSGTFLISMVFIDDWKNPNKDLQVENRLLRSEDMLVLNIPPGYGTAFRALEADSELLVYADYAIAHAVNDDYTWPPGYFKNI